MPKPPRTLLYAAASLLLAGLAVRVVNSTSEYRFSEIAHVTLDQGASSVDPAKARKFLDDNAMTPPDTSERTLLYWPYYQAAADRARLLERTFVLAAAALGLAHLLRVVRGR